MNQPAVRRAPFATAWRSVFDMNVGHPLPLNKEDKKPSVTGHSGGEGTDIMPARAEMLASQFPSANIGIRLSYEIIALDFDEYKRPGLFESFREKFGWVPTGPRSTSKDDGASGVYLLRIPVSETRRYHANLSGAGLDEVDIIHRGYRNVVVGPSIHPKTGKTYRWIWGEDEVDPPALADLEELPQNVLAAITKDADGVNYVADNKSWSFEEIPEEDREAYKSALEEKGQSLLDDALNRLESVARLGEGERSPNGEGWETGNNILYAFMVLAEIRLADWCSIHVGNAIDARDWPQAFKTFARNKALLDRPKPAPPLRYEESDDPFDDDPRPVWKRAVTETIPPGVSSNNKLNVGNVALMADWLRDEVGRGRLAGIFLRADEMVYTPLIGEQGYIDMTSNDSNHDGLAQVRPMSPNSLQARVQYNYRCFEYVEDESDSDKPKRDRKKRESPKMFPTAAAITAVSAPDMMENLRPLGGVVHAPTVRADGTLLTEPGYDESTSLLFLPPIGERVEAVPEIPSESDVQTASKTLAYMLQDFSFVSESDKANYVGLLMTPLLRNMAPAPYKLGIIEAHQPGSGKTFLARAMITVHGGIFRSEFPYDDVELAKSVTSIRDMTPGPVVVFDNAAGTIKSPVLAGLLTTPTWSDRRLGTGKTFTGKNDRLWCVTGNNLAISGDIARRALRVRIDPGVPQPELRSNFVIQDFEAWVRENKNTILWSLLVLIRHWVASGKPLAAASSSDSFGNWTRTIRGILTLAGMPGTFDDKAVMAESIGTEDEEWEEFLQAIYEVKKAERWTAVEILDLINDGQQDLNVFAAQPIGYDALPSELANKRKSGQPLSKLSKSLGWWLRNRAGRYAGDLCVVQESKSTKYVYWMIRKHGE